MQVERDLRARWSVGCAWGDHGESVGLAMGCLCSAHALTRSEIAFHLHQRMMTMVPAGAVGSTMPLIARACRDLWWPKPVPVARSLRV